MHQEHEYNIIDSKSDFDGWTILHVEDYKPGVKRITMRKIDLSLHTTILIVFSDEKYLEGLSYDEYKR